jgi:hypothetical protein
VPTRAPAAPASTTRERRSAWPTDQAWKGQPRGVCGGPVGDLGDVSEAGPIEVLEQWRQVATVRLAHRLGRGALHPHPASTNGPRRQFHAVP